VRYEKCVCFGCFRLADVVAGDGADTGTDGSDTGAGGGVISSMRIRR
jgi:hypothetical protein